MEDETLELAAPAFGSLIHDVLNDFGQSAYSEATTAEPIEEFLLRTLNSLALQRFGRNRSATVSVQLQICLLYTSPSPRDQRGARMPSSA